MPILLLTAYDEEKDYQKAVEVGADALVPQPMMAQDLLAQISIKIKSQ